MKYAAKKIGLMLLTMVIVSFLAFLAFQVIPGDPAVKLLGTEATPERIAALRAGWYKVHRPAEYYAAYFTGRGEDFDAETVSKGRESVRQKMAELRNKGKEATQKETDMIETLQVVNEAMARGVKFLPVDLYKSHPYKYLMEDGKIRMPFSAVKGLGGAAAQGRMEARESGEEFISCDDLQARSGISKAVVESLRQLGVLEGLPETSQMTFF